jgi:uncharacterized protein YkwD
MRVVLRRALPAALLAVLLVTPAASGAATLDPTQSATLTAVNAARAVAGLRPLQPDARLARAAAAHSGRMLRTGRLSHGNWEKRVRHATPAASVGEVIGYVPAADPAALGADIVRGWLDSPPHREILLSAAYGSIGVGYAGGGGEVWFTADVAGS